MLSIQPSLLTNTSTFSLSPLISFLQSLSKPLLLLDSSLLSTHLSSLSSLFHTLSSLKGRRLSQAYSMCDILLFNLSMTLERTRIVFENALVESTGMEEFDQKKVVERAEGIERMIGEIVGKVVGEKGLEEMLLGTKGIEGVKSVELSGLVETVEFIGQKYSQSFSTQVKEQISHLLLPPSPLTSSHITTLQKLFNNNSSYLLQYIQTSTPQRNHSLYLLLHSNDSKRPLFSSIIPIHHILTNLITYMLRQNTNQQCLLFSNQHYGADRVCRFLVGYMMFEFVEIVGKFGKILERFEYYEDERKYYTKNVTLFNQIYSLLSQYHPSPLSHFLHTIFKPITLKYSSQQSIQLLKLLFLNRFFLSPQLHNLYSPITSQFSYHANRIKNIFFPSKVKHIEEIKGVSLSCYGIFAKLCKEGEKGGDRKLFVKDMILRQAVSDLERKSDDVVLSQPNAMRIHSTPSLSNTSIAKHLLLDLDLKQDQQLSSSPHQMMEWLIEFKKELNHKVKERQRYQRVCEESDQKVNEEFKRVSEGWKEWKQAIMQSKRKYKNNAMVQF